MVEFKFIGTIHSAFKSIGNMPIQPISENSNKGYIEVFPEYEEGLLDIEGFSHIHLIYYFHLLKHKKLTVLPFMDNKEHGIFATRAPARPNPIGLSLVELIRRDGNILYVKNLDVIDGTPLIDIKPFFEKFDNRFNTKNGWLGNKQNVTHVKSDKRFK